MGTLGESDAQDREAREVCCSVTSGLIRVVRTRMGETGVREMLAHVGSTRETAFLENTDNWISHEEAVALLQSGIDVTGDPHLARTVGEDAVRQHAGTQVATLLRSLGSPEAVLSGVTAVAAKFSTVSDYETVESGPGRAVVRARARNGFSRHPLMCEWARGLLSAPTMLFGLAPARVTESECQARGASACTYVVSWDEEAAALAADPEQRVTALEAQVVAMAQRLESAYATASDLVSTDDLETVLARIVERAANAVRAPGYVLAVRVETDGPLRIFSEGLPPQRAHEIASGAADAPVPSMDGVLVVEVASSRRRYGRLAAVHPTGAQFFAQEQQLLTLYAKHAAAVLDTAMALEEAARRHQHVSALLALSQALAQAGTTEEIATRLCQSVLEVIDCDRASVWIWDEHERQLVREGDGAPAEISPEQTPYLNRMLVDPQPMFFDDCGEDPLLVAIMTDPRLVAMALVPIIAREVFLGLLSVGVDERAERLAATSELTEKLEGVAALTATALQNGRLIDELGRQVVHDGLTGVLNRRGFGWTVEEVLEGVRDEGTRAGLLFVDLDSFKSLNDAHGHQVGDAILQGVAERLRTCLRSDDVVARLGGDEFAVILPRAETQNDLDAARERVREALSSPIAAGVVTVSLTASVGTALAPANGVTIDDLVRHADEAMYREKARRGGVAAGVAAA